ncbi:DDX19B isoform 10 [Pongo abelii]|uniref:DEAD-box helicase 19B n=2 Tax=Hominidae TaxID=9604 RepID=H3BMV7_HUMAN|nr:DDX19B isoform 10 [Pongo abelii]
MATDSWALAVDEQEAAAESPTELNCPISVWYW